MTLRILCLDIEGGHGGSSRSLLNSLSALPRQAAAVEVVCRRGGWIEGAYLDIGIHCSIETTMPTFTTLDQGSRNLFDGFQFLLRRWPQSANFRSRLLEKLETVDLVHCNHISLFMLARWLKQQRPNVPVTMHIRTQPSPTIAARWQAQIAAKTCDGLIHISENEQAHFAALSLNQRRPPEAVIYNPVAANEHSSSGANLLHPSIPRDGRLIVTCLSNFAYARGVDRLVKIAQSVPPELKENILFVVAGEIALNGKLPPQLARIAKHGGSLADYATKVNVSDQFLFLGHVNEPSAVLAASDVLLKPTRGNNPWGRDILEAMANELPVASVGRYKKFVETGQTGLLQDAFDAQEVADWLTKLDADRDYLNVLGRKAKARIVALCDPADRAWDILKFWHDVAQRSADPDDLGLGASL
jgi:glycosyltransferase involved in cell wall biosynthesis